MSFQHRLSVERYVDAVQAIVEIAKSTNVPHTVMDSIDLILTSAVLYCTDEAKMPTKDACDFVDARLGVIFEQIGQSERGTDR